MDKRTMQRWVKALRSGKYKQTHNVLQDNKGFCCLGVLCDLYKKNLTVKKSYNAVYYDDAHQRLPPRLWTKLNMKSSDPRVMVNGQKRQLSLINDSGKSFKQIANIIIFCSC